MGIELVVGFIVIAIVVIGIALNPNKKEMLDLNKDGKVDLDDAKVAVEKVEEIVDAAEEVADKVEDLAAKYGKLSSKTKARLEEIGRELGVELDRRKTKVNMISDLEEVIKEKSKK
jgi:predicted DsbA family dithiol-disulfide isomerase